MPNEIDVVKPTVRISGADVTDMQCLQVVRNAGVKPSTCLLRYVAGVDATGPITLTNGGSYQHRQRVIVYQPDQSIIRFHGWLTNRQDQHAMNTVLWTATDDTMLLRDVPIRGCIYVDTLLNGTRALKYSASLPTTFNPNGAWNCTGYDIGGTVYPVFAPTAEFSKAYESPDLDYSGDPNTSGDHEPWTPRRVLKYLQLLMHYDEITGLDRLDGMTGSYENAINSDYLELSLAHINGLDGIDPGLSSVDPLDRSVQGLQLQGDTMMGGFIKTLDAAGTHQVATIYDTTSLTAGKTLLRFKPVGYADQSEWTNIDVQFNGTVNTDYGTIKDFTLSEDSSEATRAVVCEGESIKVETRLEYADSASDTIKPAWTEEEQNSFLRCIYGNVSLTGNAGQYAIFPKTNGLASSTSTDYLDADGSNGTRPIYSCTPEAVALARQSFPTVFRAFVTRATGNLLDALQTPADSNGTMIASRPILPEQLQFLTWQAEEIGDYRLRANLPIRLSIQPEAGEEYYDLPRDTAIRVTTDDQGNNLIWIDGASEGADGTLECIYTASIVNGTVAANIKSGAVKLRNFRLNCALATDYRTSGVRTATLSWLSNDYYDAFAGSVAAPIRYLDRPGSFREHIQYNSYPAASTQFFGGTNGTTLLPTPLNRDVPPGSEYENATFAAEREVARRKEIRRKSSWIQFGIGSGLDAGDWLGEVYIWTNGQNTDSYLVNGVVGTVVYDFLKQETRIGDVFNEYGRY